MKLIASSILALVVMFLSWLVYDSLGSKVEREEDVDQGVFPFLFISWITLSWLILSMWT